MAGETKHYTSASWKRSGVGTVIRTLGSKLEDRVSVEDFGAEAGGNVNCAAAFAAALRDLTR